MITIACCLWDANDLSADFSRCYDETWVDKLYRGFERNLTKPFSFACFTDRERNFREPVEQIIDKTLGMNGYGDCIAPFILDEPMIFCGLDTVITGNCDEFANYCLTSDIMALPQHPREPQHACNGIALVPAGYRKVYEDWRGENDMVWLRKWPHVYIDAIFKDQVKSYKAHVREFGLGDARIVYFHGRPKQPDLNEAWIKENWR
ncbi:hypothetical protein LB553_01115 [Mesorhizobium sp. CA8]|uniref:hypothetical protein n=1 Tax=Mesorhizobium sp. CA8 TaxID=2876637 RepID=UPI001CCED098|nr:hypothetical protein [Mesorhizobium sp. CA8]MBZ9759486.1 hypothetical protein [Mesorhizobium sp. CA8]